MYSFECITQTGSFDEIYRTNSRARELDALQIYRALMILLMTEINDNILSNIEL